MYRHMTKRTQRNHKDKYTCQHTHILELFRACLKPELATADSQDDKFPIFANCGGGKIIALRVSPTDTCENIKKELGRRLNRSASSFRVVFSGKEVRGGSLISDLNIRSESTLEYSEFLLGGMMQESVVPIANLSCPQAAAPDLSQTAVSSSANSFVSASPQTPPPGPDFVDTVSTPSGETQPDIQMSEGSAISSLVREEWQGLIDYVIAQAPSAVTIPDAKLWALEDITCWERVRSSLLALGLNYESDDPWLIVGLHKESGPSALELESRRRTLQSIFKALAQVQSSMWDPAVRDQAEVARNRIEAAIDECQKQLPEILKKLKRKKKTASLIPQWQEPSPALLEWALSLRGYHVALHLSNLQKAGLESLARPDNQLVNSAVETNILDVTGTRSIYTKLFQTKETIREVFTTVAGAGLVLWAPDDADTLTQWLKVWDEMHEERFRFKLKILATYSPFPTCVDPHGILDFWTHPLLHNTPYNNSRISGIELIKEASSCIFTRFENPSYQIKNVCVITLEYGVSSNRPDPVSIHIGSGGELTHQTSTWGEMFYIDVPSNVVAPAREVLLGVSRRSAYAPKVWRDSFRSRGSGRDNPRDVITGTVDYNIDLQSNAILKMIISALEAAGIHSCAGRQQIFQNKNAMIFEFNKTTQYLAMHPFLGESILLSPGKCLCLPSVDGSVLTRALTESEELHTAKFRFRRSGPMSGPNFRWCKGCQGTC